ncbi:Mycolipanoate synthase [Marasmius sp. AFHP31]|nr:Mycolipanoate synthase [Marasmius sp. AFHP31]
MPQEIPIAIVGIAAELPSGTESQGNLDYREFVKFLQDGKEAYEKIPLERFDIDAWKGSQAGRVLIENGTFLKDIDAFDYVEFGIKPTDARSMPVSTRILIELAFRALLDSGIDYRTRNVGCFTSGIMHDALALSDIDEYEPRGTFGGIPAQMANRVSYHLDLLGPSVPTDTACSSSLTAMHLAVQAIRSGECEAALVGGCQINQRFLDFVQYSQAGVLAASDGKCKPFDAAADGFSRGEGAVAVVIKPLEEALKDNDKIYGTILGTGINSTGCAAPAYAPVASAQRDAMIRAFKMAGRNPGDVDFVELHATGTASGDPTEANWVGEAFQRPEENSDKDLLIGSVKGNLGHLEITSFLASLCKVCGAFETGIIPANVNLRNLNPKIKWDQYSLKVPRECTPLPCRSSDRKSLVSIASSGIGGATGHVVLEGPPPTTLERPKSSDTSSKPALFVVGGLSPRTTSSVADSAAALLREHPDAAPNLSVAYGRRSRQMTWRSFAVIDPTNMSKIRFSQPVLTTRTRPPVGFVFSGQGPQHINMGRQLFEQYASFRESILELDACYKSVVGESLIETTGLFDSSKPAASLPDVWPISLILPSICMVQVAMYDLLRSLGISSPDFVMGHSAGETTLLYASGATPKTVALEIAIARGQSLALTENAEGTMGALSCGIAGAENLIVELGAIPTGAVLDIACHNSDDSVAISGRADLVDRVVELAKAKGIAAQRLRTKVAVHSQMMELCEADYRQRITSIFDHLDRPAMPTVDVYSTVSGEKLQGAFTAEYFWQNTRKPVLFTQALRSVKSASSDKPTFIEIGPHPVLHAYLSAGFPEATIISSMRRTKQMTENFERNVFLQALGSYAVAGHNSIDFAVLNNGASHQFPFALPPYPFSRKSVPAMSQSIGQDKVLALRRGPLNSPRLRINADTHPDMAQHIMKGEPILPATGFVEMAIEFGARMLWDVKFHSFLSLSSDTPAAVSVTTDGCYWSVKTPSASSSPHNSKADRLHADGYLSMQDPEATLPAIDLRQVCRASQQVNVEGFYADLRHFAEYGEGFQLVKSCFRSEAGFLVEVNTRRNHPPSYNYVFDPAVLDACIHVMVHPLITGTVDKNTYYLPSGFRRFFLFDLATTGQLPETLFAYGSNASWTPDALSYDVTIVDSEGRPLAHFQKFEVAMHTVDPDMSVSYALQQETQATLDIVDLVQNATDVPLVPQTVVDGTNVYFVYAKDHESTLQEYIDTIDLRVVKVIWIFAMSGLDGGAALGFSRSLRREILSCRVRLVVMEQSLSLDDARQIASLIPAGPSADDEVMVNLDGVVSAYRLKASSPPSKVAMFDAERPWMLTPSSDGSDSYSVQQSLSPAHVRGEFLVQVEYVQQDAWKSGVWGLVGRLEQGGDYVLGITSKAVSSSVSLPPAQFVRWNHFSRAKTQAAGYATALVLGHLLLDGSCPQLSPQRPTTLITHADTNFGLLLKMFFEENGYQVTSLGSTKTTLSAILSIPVDAFDLVLSGSTDQNIMRVLKSLCSRKGRSFFWACPDSGLSTLLEKEPSRVSSALCSSLRGVPHSFSRNDFGMQVSSLLDGASKIVAPPSASLFDSKKTYILLGGIGSLGLRMAAWMYSHGARFITLTSRSGRQTLERTLNYPALRILGYLESLSDLSLSISASDASSPSSLKELISHTISPIGGVFVLTAVLEDQPFTSSTPSQESFARVFGAKVGVLQSLEEALSIQSLDFLVCLTSISGLFGSAGQTNYAAANTALEELTRKYGNTFCFVAPAIVDTAIAFGSAESKTSRNTSIKHITEWGMSTRDICFYLEDGLRKLQSDPVSSLWLYIPPFDFPLVKKHIGVSPLFAHLLPVSSDDDDSSSGNAETDNSTTAVQDIILKLLDIDPADFSLEVPLTSFGLDSLLASKLSVLLRRWAPITQLQLLADMTMNDIMSRIAAAAESTQASDSAVDDKEFFDWEEVMRTGPTVVKLSEGKPGEIPLFLLHGPAGTIEAFDTLRRKFTTPLYGVQCTPAAPYGNLRSLAKFYFTQIKAVQPHGPYRLGGFCGSSLLVFILAEEFQGNGDVVSHALLIDHFPLLYASPIWQLDCETATACCVSPQLRKRGFDWIMSLYANETNPSEKRVGEELMKAGESPSSVRPHMMKQYENTMTFIGAQALFISETFVDSADTFDGKKVLDRFVQWLSENFKFPVTLFQLQWE